MIELHFSVDAATEETYNEIRPGGSFIRLCKNLDYASALRKQNRARFLGLNFVVQRKNVNEMKDFVLWGERLCVDRVHFTRILNWGTYDDEYYKKNVDIYDDENNMVPELKETLKDPVFSHSIVQIDF